MYYDKFRHQFNEIVPLILYFIHKKKHNKWISNLT